MTASVLSVVLLECGPFPFPFPPTITFPLPPKIPFPFPFPFTATSSLPSPGNFLPLPPVPTPPNALGLDCKLLARLCIVDVTCDPLPPLEDGY